MLPLFSEQSISAAEFLSQYWQKKPFLFKSVNLNLNCLPNRRQLFELARQEGVQSRIVYTEDGQNYRAAYDQPEAWEELSDCKPTMLVSDIEKWFPATQMLLDSFPFIKSWRLDDLMMSFAPKGTSVGAHTDHYDVFLLQTQGKRTWHYDNQPLTNARLSADSELSVLNDYQAQNTAVLEAGDMLYLPPEVPHHGISESDDCITCSIGLRSPSQAEMLMAAAEQYCESLSEDGRFTDRVETSYSDASIGMHEVHFLRQQLYNLAKLDDHELAEIFGRFITDYRRLEEAPVLHNRRNNHWWKKSPFSSWAYHVLDKERAILFVDGEVYHCSVTLAKQVCDCKQLALIEQATQWQESEKQLLRLLIEQQALIPV